jgi:hypothetical protein
MQMIAMQKIRRPNVIADEACGGIINYTERAPFSLATGRTYSFSPEVRRFRECSRSR